jgi:uncharacterized protein (TIGR00369 family)
MSSIANAMPFARLLGIEISQAQPDQIVGAITVRDELCTAGETIHGGALMAFADSLAAIGAFLNLPDGAAGTTTIESKTNFLGRAPANACLVGIATPISIGRRLSVWQTRIHREEDRAVAMVTQTQLVL